MYWFLAICIWPFTRAFARVVDFFLNLIEKGSTTDYFVRALTKPWEDNTVRRVVKTVAYFTLMFVSILLAIITVRNDYLLLWGVELPSYEPIVVLVLGPGIPFIIIYLFAIAEDSPLRRSWRARHNYVFVTYRDFQYGVFKGTPSEYYKKMKGSLRIVSLKNIHGDGLCEVSIPQSWMFGWRPYVTAYRDFSIRPVLSGRDFHDYVWVLCATGERLLWGYTDPPSFFDLQNGRRDTTVFTRVLMRVRDLHEDLATSLRQVALVIEESKKSSGDQNLRRLKETCRALANDTQFRADHGDLEGYSLWDLSASSPTLLGQETPPVKDTDSEDLAPAS